MGPRDLAVTEISYSSLRLTWTPATGGVLAHRLLVTPLTATGQLLLKLQKQVRVGGHTGKRDLLWRREVAPSRIDCGVLL